MIWVCRAGASGKNYDYFINNQRIYLSWDGYQVDLSQYDDMSKAKEIVSQEKGTTNSTAVSTWATQIVNFVKLMSIGDYVMIPSQNSREYCLAIIDGAYQYLEEDPLYTHSRKIKIVKENIKRDIFPAKIANTLGAFRTVFKAGKDEEIIEILKNNNCL